MVVQKIVFGGWVGPVYLVVFVDTHVPISRINCLTMMCSKWESEQKLYILGFFTKIIFFWFLNISDFFLNLLLKSQYLFLKYSWPIFTCKVEICIFGKTPKINSYKTVSKFTKEPQDRLRDHLSVILVTMGTMSLLVNFIMKVLVIKSNKYHY